MSGFRGTGLFPQNPDAISDAAFAPSLVADEIIADNNEDAEGTNESLPTADGKISSDDENIPIAALAGKINPVPQQSSPVIMNKSFQELLPTPTDGKNNAVKSFEL